MAIKMPPLPRGGFGKQRNFVVAAVTVALLILILTSALLIFHATHYFDTPKKQHVPSSPPISVSSSSSSSVGRDALKKKNRVPLPEEEETDDGSLSTQERSQGTRAERAMRAVSQVSDRGRRFVIATAGTYGYREHVSNLACSLLRSGHKLLLVALDERIYATARDTLPANVRPLLLPLDITSSRDSAGAVGEGYHALSRFGTRGFNDLTRRKLTAAARILRAGYDVLFVDGDAVFCNAKLGVAQLATEIHNYRGAHIIAQRAAIRNQWINTGLYYARATPETIALFEAAEKFHLPQDDQAIVNKLACEPRYGGKMMFSKKIYNKKLLEACRWKNTTTIAFLPSVKFPLGCTNIDGRRVNAHSAQNIRKLCSTRRVALVHYSCFSATRKKSAMRSHGMWLTGGSQHTDQCSKLHWMPQDR